MHDSIQIILDVTAALLAEAESHALAVAVTGADLNPLETLGQSALQGKRTHDENIAMLIKILYGGNMLDTIAPLERSEP